MSQNDQSSVLKVGSWLFYICWLACLSVIVWILIWKIGSIQSPYGFFLFLVLICMVMLPFLKSFAVGNIFSVHKRGRWFQNDLPTEYIKGIGFLYAKAAKT